MVSIPHLFTISFSLICIVSLFFGIYTIYMNPKAVSNRIFFALTMALVIWSFGFAMAISAPNLSVCLFWRRFAAIGWSLFFSILLHFMIYLSGRGAFLDKWWKYVLLYFPAAVCLSVFTYIPVLNPQQYKMIHTEMGWVNVSIKNFWDWFFILYYASYSLIGMYLVWRWGKTAESRNIQKQSGIINRSFLITLILGAFTESVVNNVFPVKIPQIAPILMLIPVVSISYAMQRYGLMDSRKKTADALLFSEQIRTRIIQYMANSLFAASIMNIMIMYCILRSTLVSTLLLSSFMIIAGVSLELIQRLNKSSRYKDYIYAATFFVLIPILTLSFIEYAGVTVWALAFIFLIISIAMVSRVIQIAVAVSIVLTQLAVFLVKPIIILQIDAVDYVGRIGISLITIWVAFFVMNVFRSKLLENAHQINFQSMVEEISTRYASAGEKDFDKVTHKTLERISAFLKTEGAFIYVLSPEKDTLVRTCSWTDGQHLNNVVEKTIRLNDYPHFQKKLSGSRVLEIYDTDDLPSDENRDFARIFGEKVRSLLILPIENNDTVYGYLVLQSVNFYRAWSAIDKNNLMIITDIIAVTMERIRQEKQIHYMAYYDLLTGLPNRTLFKDRLNQAVLIAERKSEIIAILLLDLDSFKNVNDTIGYEGGDELILAVSRKLCQSLRKSDTVSRFGEDEFLIMVQNIRNTKDVIKVVDKVIGVFRKPFTVHNQEIYISASVGIAVYPYDGRDADTLIRNADIAMNEAKSRGKGQYCLCTEEMKEEVLLKHELSNKLYRAIDNNELFLQYQPMVSAKTGDILCVEALVRWRQPEHGLISPGFFIPLAEQNGLIGPIGEWVLRTACRQAKTWQEMGLPPVHISVNVSVLQLLNPRFVRMLRRILDETGLGAEYLDLEITESVAVKEFDKILDVLKELRELGVEISIDDFGTEYSSLSRLNHMPVNRIKIDRSFISNLFRSEKEQTLVKGMIHLSQTLGLKVVAEGVEDENQLRFLREHGCDEIQGYYISRPVHAEDLLKLFKKA